MKLVIKINSGTLAGKEYELTVGFLSIGRSETCSIKFDPFNEKIASKQHAFIEATPNGFYITDNGSTNGTLVNNQKVTKQKLNSGDKIQFGTNGVEATVEILPSQIVSTRETYPLINQDENPPITAQMFDQMQLQSINQVVPYAPTGIIDSVSTLGLGNLQLEAKEDKTGKYIGIAVTLLVLVFLGLIVTAIMFYNLGPVAAIIAAVVAFVPSVIYISPIVWLDRYDPEPFWLLALSFAWGALIAVIISYAVNVLVGKGALSLPTDPEIANFLSLTLSMVISAPIIEELTKGAGLLVIVLFFRKYFDGVLDGIIFAGIIALGFSTVENVLYYGGQLLQSGFGGLFGVFIARGVFTPFAHVTFTSMTGIGFGLSRESHNKLVRFAMPLVGILFAIGLHMFWNGTLLASALFANSFGPIIILLFVLFELIFFFGFVGFSFWIMWRQNRIIREMLAIDVARGLIPNEHFEKATSAFKSTGWLIGSVFQGKYKATSRYIRAIGKLGLSYWHIQRATAAQGETVSFQQNPILRDEVLKWRDQV